MMETVHLHTRLGYLTVHELSAAFLYRPPSDTKHKGQLYNKFSQIGNLLQTDALFSKVGLL